MVRVRTLLMTSGWILVNVSCFADNPITSQNCAQIMNLHVIIQYVLFQESEALIVWARSSPADWSSLLMQCHLHRKTLWRRRPCRTRQPGSSSCEAAGVREISGKEHWRRPKYTTSLSPSITTIKSQISVFISIYFFILLCVLFILHSKLSFSLMFLFHSSFFYFCLFSL